MDWHPHRRKIVEGRRAAPSRRSSSSLAVTGGRLALSSPTIQLMLLKMGVSKKMEENIIPEDAIPSGQTEKKSLRPPPDPREVKAAALKHRKRRGQLRRTQLWTVSMFWLLVNPSPSLQAPVPSQYYTKFIEVDLAPLFETVDELWDNIDWRFEKLNSEKRTKTAAERIPVISTYFYNSS